MPRNVEIKARVRDLDALERRASCLADGPPTSVEQNDVFFRTPRGRLKLRSFPTGHGELIYYERPDATGPATSEYRLVEVPDAEPLERLLSAALGTRGRVSKHRRVYLVGQTRIHVDRVERLGAFLELEVVLAPQQDAREGADIAAELLRSLEIGDDDLVDRAYIDLLMGPE